MALVRFGNGISEIRGSIAGTTFARSFAGAIAKNRITPTNPNTQAQASVRSLFAFVSWSWTQLTPSQKDEWTEYAKELKFFTNRLGESYTPTGKLAFQSCNINRILTSTIYQQASQSYTWDTSLKISNPNWTYTEKPENILFTDPNFTVGLTSGEISQIKSASDMLAPAAGLMDNFIIEAQPFTAPRRYLNRQYRLLTSQTIDPGNQLDITSTYNAVLPQSSLSTGMQARIRISLVNDAGLRSDPVEYLLTT